VINVIKAAVPLLLGIALIMLAVEEANTETALIFGVLCFLAGAGAAWILAQDD